MATTKAFRRQRAKTIRYLKGTEPYGDILSAKELAVINKKVATRLAKRRAGLRGRK